MLTLSFSGCTSGASDPSTVQVGMAQNLAIERAWWHEPRIGPVATVKILQLSKRTSDNLLVSRHISASMAPSIVAEHTLPLTVADSTTIKVCLIIETQLKRSLTIIAWAAAEKIMQL